MNIPHTESTNKSRGFTLIELIIVVVIIGILAGLVLLGYGSWRQTAITTQMKLDLNSAATAMINTQSTGGKYPETIPSTFTPSEDITLIGGSNDGETYCIEATSAKDISVKYHIVSGSSTVESGGCPPPVTFIMGWGSTSTDFGQSLVQTSDGGYAVTGETFSYDVGNGDMFLAKYASDGTLSWSKTWGGVNTDMGNSLVQTSDGGYAVTGMADGNMLLAKYTSDGTLSWSKTWDGGYLDRGNSIVQTSDGGYAVTGYKGLSTGGQNMLIAKYTSDGTLSWSKTWGGANIDYGNALVQTSDDGYLVTGGSSSYRAGSYDMFLAKYSSDGTLSWSRTWGSTSLEVGNSLVQTSDDGYAVTGYTMSYTAGSTDMFLAKYASDGTLSWSKTWGGTGEDYGSSLVQTSDDGYAVTGYTRSYTLGNYDILLAKYASDGTLSWSKTWGGINADYSRSIVQTSDGGYAVTGYTLSYTTGDNDMFLAKYTSDGTITNCLPTMCQDRDVAGVDRSVPIVNRSVSNVNPTVTSMTPSYPDVLQDAAHAVIVAP
ncbi:MAG: prepilin-type N-terminal cleavage/methylation domain-containing protein [Candidatus Saccharimonadales bacterium]